LNQTAGFAGSGRVVADVELPWAIQGNRAAPQSLNHQRSKSLPLHAGWLL
jgi:hypothetical protein